MRASRARAHAAVLHCSSLARLGARARFTSASSHRFVAHWYATNVRHRGIFWYLFLGRIPAQKRGSRNAHPYAVAISNHTNIQCWGSICDPSSRGGFQAQKRTPIPNRVAHVLSHELPLRRWRKSSLATLTQCAHVRHRFHRCVVRFVLSASRERLSGAAMLVHLTLDSLMCGGCVHSHVACGAGGLSARDLWSHHMIAYRAVCVRSANSS